MPDTVQGWLDPLWQPHSWCHQHCAQGWQKGFCCVHGVGTWCHQEPCAWHGAAPGPQQCWFICSPSWGWNLHSLL